MQFAHEGAVLEFAHELKNHLTFLKASCFTLSGRSDTEDPKFSHHLRMLKETIHAIESVLLRLKPPSSDGNHIFSYRAIDVGLVVLEALSPWREGLLEKRIHLKERITQRPCFVLGDRERLKLILRNLVTNACEAMPEGGELRISVYLREGMVEVRALDSGCGIPKEVLSKLGEPYFTTKDSGTGLGVHLSKRIAQDHKGELWVRTGRWGSCFILRLPLVRGVVQ